MLAAKLATLEGVDETIAKEYKKVGEEFVLQVTKVGGLGLEDVSGLKAATEALRSEKKILEKEVKTSEKALSDHREKFADIDPVTAKEAVEKLKEVADWDGDKKVAEAVKLAVDEANKKSEDRTTELLTAHGEKVTSLTADFDGSQAQLRTALVTSRIVEAIVKEGGNSALLMPHVERQVDMIKGDDGKWISQVLNAKGEPRLGDAATNKNMTIDELIVEMKSDKVYAACFTGAGSTGSGKGPTQKSAQTPASKDKIIHIKSNDQEAIDANVEGLGNGTVVIDPVE